MTRNARIPHLHAMILAGGSGTRFWPLSRELSPKQFVTMFGGVSLITQAVARVRSLVEADGIHVLTNERLLDELHNHLTAQPLLEGCVIEYLAEPTPRNTAAAIALAAAHLERLDPDAILVVLPSDHVLEDGERWERTVRVAVALAETGRLVTLGLEPTRPETGYGYIRMGGVIPGASEGETAGHDVSAFIEKPDQPTAERFLAEGGYLWNSGMLVARATTVLAELEAAGTQAATPESERSADIARVAREVAALEPSAWTADDTRAKFLALPSVPFDKAVLEVSAAVAVVPADLEWSDVGSLAALEAIADPDERGNIHSGNVLDIDSHGTIVYSADRLVATIGLADLMVVDTPDATLVAPRDRAQDVRLIVDALKASGAREVVENRSSLRPWGTWTMLVKGTGFQVKTIEVQPGQRLSLQSHERRSEHWVVVEGRGRITRGAEVFDVGPNESAYIPRGFTHRLENPGSEILRIVEIAVGDYLGEDDIIRYEDDWER